MRASCGELHDRQTKGNACDWLTTEAPYAVGNFDVVRGLHVHIHSSRQVTVEAVEGVCGPCPVEVFYCC